MLYVNMKYISLIIIQLFIAPLLVFPQSSPPNFKDHVDKVLSLTEDETVELEDISFQIDEYLAKNPLLFDRKSDRLFYYFYTAARIKQRLNKDIYRCAEQALKLAEDLQIVNKEVAEINYWIGSKRSDERNILIAETYLLNALNISKSSENLDSIFVADVYYKLGLNHIYSGNSEKAIDMLNSALYRYESLESVDKRDIISIYDGIGITYYNVGDHEKAIEYYLLALKLIQEEDNQDKFSALLGDVYNHMGSAFIKVGLYDNALEYNFKALKLRQQQNKGPNNLVSDSFDGIGRIYRKKNEPEKALLYFLKSLPLKKEYYQGDHADIAYSHFLMGHVHFDKEDYNLAIQSYSKCMSILERVSTKKYRLYIDAYIKLANTYKADASLVKALQTYEEVIELKNTVRREFQNTNSSLSSLNALGTTEEALAITYELFEKNQDVGYLERAFKILEENQAARLLDALHATAVNSFGDIPDEQLSLGDSLKNKITRAEINWFEANKAKKDSITSQKSHQVLLDAKEQWYEYKKNIKREYPDYFDLQLNPEIASLNTFQTSIVDDEQLIVEYFVGKKHIYIFALSNSEVEFRQVPLDFPLNDWVDKLRNYISYASGSYNGFREKEIEKLNNEYLNVSHNLYQKLILPIDSSMLKSKSLIIIPDKLLGYIPFDILLSKRPKKFIGFRSLDYLLVNHSISYAYSANLLYRMSLKFTSTVKNLIAFSPNLDDLQRDSTEEALFEKLKYSEEELDAIGRLFPAKLVKGKSANVDSFKKLSSNYSIIHLSTHGKADDRLGDYCYLAFSPTSHDQSNYALYVKDLYNLKLSAEMVVLSACETGIGELREGEGIMSLGRGFTYAGAKSIISTLWSVNDRSTMEIMNSFYSYLKDGLQKDEALRNAKLDYLNKTVRPNPAYWAGFTATGDMSAFSFKTNLFYSKNTILFGSLAFLSILWLSLKFLLKKRMVF